MLTLASFFFIEQHYSATHTNARVRPLTSRLILIWFPKSFGRLLRKLVHIYIAMRQIHREIILGKKRVETERRESRLRLL